MVDTVSCRSPTVMPARVGMSQHGQEHPKIKSEKEDIIFDNTMKSAIKP